MNMNLIIREILDEIIPRFTALQVYQAILESQASEHAARMVAMRNATDNAKELVGALQLAYNKVRQQAITNDILDIVGGAEALAAEITGGKSWQMQQAVSYKFLVVWWMWNSPKANIPELFEAIAVERRRKRTACS